MAVTSKPTSAAPAPVAQSTPDKETETAPVAKVETTDDRSKTTTFDNGASVTITPGEGDGDGAGRRTCVVDTEKCVGAATPGSLVCSYHAMHYTAAGELRADVQNLNGN